MPMRKITFPLILLLLVMGTSGCNLPRSSQLTATPDLVATQVATMLAGMPTADLQSTLTPAPQQPTPEIVLATPTPTVMVTATAVTGDPLTILGDPAYRDTFENSGLWGLDDPYDDGHTRVEIRNNRLVLTSLKAESWMGWRTTYPKPGNAYIEATVTGGECSGGDQYGLVFRSTDNGSDFFTVTCDGRFSLTHFDGSTFSRLLDWQSSGAILTGSNQTNRIGVWLDGNQIRLYANGSLLAETSDDQLAAEGNFGLLIAAVKTANFSIEVSEIAYWNIE